MGTFPDDKSIATCLEVEAAGVSSSTIMVLSLPFPFVFFAGSDKQGGRFEVSRLKIKKREKLDDREVENEKRETPGRRQK